ncbi:MAG: DEAD/DEAH box helicase family protein [Chitinophagales bacterium]|nr:DEAD/DEAH box helicase family protein [Chitinophagales bacterium]
MLEFPKNIKFKYNWRNYQQRVLDELDEHLTDKHLHVIAPPGSGKTVLGLEVALRLNRPTLILAPTISIKNQWIQRFCELFLQTIVTPDWISRDIRNPKFLTVATYQGLHAACNNLNINEDEEDDIDEDEEIKNKKSTHKNLDNIVNLLKQQNIGTIVVDEAHHLKNEWWNTLSKVKYKLEPIIVGLTATPPYDVSAIEWQRYIDLNGAVDTEISVPELVESGDLCPHQDYIYFTMPSVKESHGILEYRHNIEKLFHDLKHDSTIVSAIERHVIWQQPIENLDWIYSNISYYSACLIYLHENNIKIPEIHLEVVGDENFEIPKLDFEWLQIVLDFYLFKEKATFIDFEAHQESIEKKLKRYGALEKKQINFLHNRRISSYLKSSISKLEGIKNIVDFEYQQLGNELRLVVLSDFIRKEYLINSSENNLEINKIGVIPIFESLRRENYNHKKIGVLTGSIIIIPKSAFSAFKTKTIQYGIENINSYPIAYDNNYIVINQTEQIKHNIVHIITQIFQEGEIEVLIGTKALLGEGWDAPAINALILASFVGSFVLSNQMRGRAIRTQKNNDNKTGNIWHLVCVDSTAKNGGDDIDLLKRRFKTFVGVSLDDDFSIENGIGRLNLPKDIHQKEDIENINKRMFTLSCNRDELKHRWKESLKTGINLVEEIKIPYIKDSNFKTSKKLYFNKTIANLVATLSSALLGFGLESLSAFRHVIRNINTLKDLYVYLSIIGTIGIILFGRLTFKTFRIYVQYRDIAKDLEQISIALLNSLIEAEIIKSDRSTIQVITSLDDDGTVYCHLEGGTTFEKSSFILLLQEIINKIDNPRYIIIRKSKFMLLLKQRDYHAVPEILAKNKKLAEYFKEQWETHVGRCELVFTRTLEGRKFLLQSRLKSLSNQLDENIEQVNKWK